MATFADTDLVVTRDVTFTRTLRYAISAVNVDWTAYTVKSQVRDRDGGLLFDLTPFFSVVPEDHTALRLLIAAQFTYALPKEGSWDLLARNNADPNLVFRTPQPAGRLLLLSGVTTLV